MFHPGPYDSTGILYYSIPSFHFIAGPNLPIRVAYRSFNPTSSRAICVPTSEHGRINNTLNFANGALKDYHVVVVAMLGNGESSSPSNTPNIPQPLYQDCINAYYELFTKHLNITELEAVVGFGMGAQQAYYWSCMRPGFVKNAVVICGSARTSHYAHMLLDGPATALISSAGYTTEKTGELNIGTTDKAHAYGKVICAWWTSPTWFKDELFKTVLGFETIRDFMDSCESSFNSWNATDLLCLVKMWQLGDIAALMEDRDYEKALENIEARVLVIVSRTDCYFS